MISIKIESTTSPFDILPLNLVEEIARLSDNTTLSNLRLTCKRIRHVADIPFCERHIVKRNHVYCKTSLKALVEITQNPVLAPHIKSIMLGSSRLSTQGLWNFITNLPECTYNVEQYVLNGMRDYFLFMEQQKDLDINGHAYDLLSQALSTVAKHNNPVVLGVWVDTANEIDSSQSSAPIRHAFTGWGHKQLYGQTFFTRPDDDEYADEPPRFDWASHLTYNQTPVASLDLLLFAAQRAKCQVDGLSLHLANVESGFLRPAHARLISQIRSLEISMAAPCADERGYSSNQCSANVTSSILRAARNLETLHLVHGAHCGQVAPPSFAVTTQYFATKKLRQLKLIAECANAEDIIHLLDQHKTTLQDLTIHVTSLRDGFRTIVCDWMARHMVLLDSFCI